MNKAFRGFANVTGPNTLNSDKKLATNQIFIPNASSGDMRILDQKSPRSDHLTRILPAQLQPKDHQEIKKLQETPSKYDPLTGNPTTKLEYVEIDINDPI